jgi:hypothetical protein
MNKRKLRFTAIGVVTLALILAGASIGQAVIARSASHRPVTPASVSAVSSSATALAASADIHGLGANFAPDAGTRGHSLGGGKAIGWKHGSQICVSSDHFGEWVSGCIDPSSTAVDWSLSVPNLPNTNPSIFGVAVDGVTSVTATFGDGASYSAPVSQNWYQIDFPASLRESDLTGLDVAFADGTHSHVPVALPEAPAGH